MSRSQEVALSDRYVLLLQEVVEESRSLRAQVAGRAEQTDQLESKLDQISSKVEDLCEKVNNADSCRKRKRKDSPSLKVPRQCRVSSIGCFNLFDCEQSICKLYDNKAIGWRDRNQS